MHILYIHQHFTVPEAGGGTRVYDFGRFLVERGHTVTLLTSSHNLRRSAIDMGRRIAPRLYRRDFDGIDALIADVPYSNVMGFAQRLGSFAAFGLLSTTLAPLLRNVDVVYASSTPLSVGFPALSAHFLRHWPYVFEVRDLWPEIPVEMGLLKNRFLIRSAELCERAFYRHAEHIVTISEGQRNRLLARGIPPEKLHVVYTGVDLQTFEAAEVNTEVIEGLGWRDRTVVVYAGAVSTVNNLGYVLDAARLARDDPRLGFLIIGRGKERATLEARASELELDNLAFIGPVPKTEIAGLLKACDAAIISAKNLECFAPGMPNKFFDYLAAGLPTFANYVAEHNDHLQENECGGYIDADDPGALVEVLRDLHENPERKQQMSKRARKLVADLFDRRKLVSSLEAVLIDAARRATKH